MTMVEVAMIMAITSKLPKLPPDATPLERNIAGQGQVRELVE